MKQLAGKWQKTQYYPIFLHETNKKQMEINWLALLTSALIPLVVGAVWYNPKVFGTAWMKASGMTMESIQSGNKLLLFGLTFLLGCFASLTLSFLVVHQGHLYSILVDEPGFGEEGSELMRYINQFMAEYGENFRTFKHGAFHGTLTGITFALPVVGILSLFERRSWKYIGIHAGYWTVVFALMGGLICGWQ